ncbi:MAG TPA: DUF1761 domain-containing protein [Candidatus Limnocylindria bacterium]|nr:DUF1761 domain-containing protein [Candidatus Limnocylindria bacterium]
MNIMVTVNIWAVLASAVASMVIGSIWFGPLFGKKYMSLMGMDQWSPEKQAEMKKGMTMTYVWQFVASVVMFYVFAWLMGALHAATAMDGIQTAFWVWLGFIVPLKLGDSLWGGKMAMFWLGIGNSILTLAAGGILIALIK